MTQLLARSLARRSVGCFFVSRFDLNCRITVIPRIGVCNWSNLIDVIGVGYVKILYDDLNDTAIRLVLIVSTYYYDKNDYLHLAPYASSIFLLDRISFTC